MSEELKMYEVEDGEKHWVIASSLRGAVKILVEHFDGDLDPSECSVKQLQGHEPLTITQDTRFGLKKKTKLVAKWIGEEKEPCFIASTVYP